MLDLDANVNLLSFSLYQKLDLGDLKPTSVALCLADRSVKAPKGIVEDVLIKVQKFVYMLISLFWTPRKGKKKIPFISS